jgi:hypothetical protein
MAIKDESLDLIHEKQELDIFLSSFKAIRLPDGVMQEKTAITAEAKKISPIIDRGKSLNLIREKEETDIFLSSIITVRLPDGIVQEKAVLTEGVREKLPVADDLSVHKEPEREGLSDEKAQPDKDELGKIVIAARAKEDKQGSVDFLKEKKWEKDNLSDIEGANEERPQIGDQGIKDDEVVVKPTDLVQVQKVAIKTDAVEVPPSAKIEMAEQPVVQKSQQETELVPETPSVKIDEKLTAKPSKKESKQVMWGIPMRLVALFLVFIIMVQGYLWIYPDVGYQTVEWMRSNIPVIDQLISVEEAQQDIITGQVEFISVRQRFVMNESSGNLRVIEGEVVNKADFPIKKIKIMGELFDSRGGLLAARISYCGNILPDEILGRLKEEDIRSATSTVQGGDLSDNKILPGGHMPFMIVFMREPAGAAKATVTAVEAERISP